MFKSHLVVQIWTIIYAEYFVNIDQKFGQKIKVKAKFSQAVITNIRTLPPVFPKMFWTAAWRKTPDGCFWHYVWKTIYSCSRKALTVFTEVCSTTFFIEIKMLLWSKKFSGLWSSYESLMKRDHWKRTLIGPGRFPELPKTPEITEMTENFMKVTKYLAKFKETLRNYASEKSHVKKQ